MKHYIIKKPFYTEYKAIQYKIIKGKVYKFILIAKQKSNQYILIFLIQILLFILTPVAFAESKIPISGEDKLTIGLALAGMLTVGTFILGLRYIVMGDSVTGVIDKTKDAGNELITNARASGNELITKAEEAGTRLIDHAGNTIDQKVDLVTTALDTRIAKFSDAINPVTHVQALGDKTVHLVKKVLNKANNALNTNTGFADLEQDVKIRLQSGLQNTLQKLDQTGNINEALANMSQSEIEMLTEYTVISREASSAGSVSSLHSVVEPLCFHPEILFFIIIILTLGKLISKFIR